NFPGPGTEAVARRCDGPRIAIGVDRLESKYASLGPSGPGSPFAPGSPFGPCGPVGPVGPCGPFGPAGKSPALKSPRRREPSFTLAELTALACSWAGPTLLAGSRLAATP